MNDNDLPYILQFIGGLTLSGIFAFMVVCTCLQIEQWYNKSNTCEVTVQKE